MEQRTSFDKATTGDKAKLLKDLREAWLTCHVPRFYDPLLGSVLCPLPCKVQFHLTRPRAGASLMKPVVYWPTEEGGTCHVWGDLRVSSGFEALVYYSSAMFQIATGNRKRTGYGTQMKACGFTGKPGSPEPTSDLTKLAERFLSRSDVEEFPLLDVEAPEPKGGSKSVSYNVGSLADGGETEFTITVRLKDVAKAERAFASWKGYRVTCNAPEKLSETREDAKPVDLSSIDFDEANVN